MSKMGRPKSDDPMRNKISIRLTDGKYERLKAYAESYNKTLTEIIKDGIELLYQEDSRE